MSRVYHEDMKMIWDRRITSSTGPTRPVSDGDLMIFSNLYYFRSAIEILLSALARFSLKAEMDACPDQLLYLP